MNENIPYKAIINISFSIYPVGPTGELSGESVHRNKLQASNLKHKIVEVKGETYEACVNNLKNTIDRMLKCNQ